MSKKLSFDKSGTVGILRMKRKSIDENWRMYKRDDFYFRGANELEEPERLKIEYNTERRRLREVKRGLLEDRSRFESMKKALEEKEKYAVALASAFGEESSQTKVSADLRKSLSTLEAEIGEYEGKIAKIKADVNYGNIMDLRAQRAMYFAEIESIQHGISTASDSIKETKNEIAMIAISNEISDAMEIEGDIELFSQVRSKLRGESSKEFKAIQSKTSVRVNTKDNPKLSALKDKLGELATVKLKHAQEIHKSFSSKVKRAKHIKVLANRIELLNSVLVMLGEEPVSIEDQFKV